MCEYTRTVRKSNSGRLKSVSHYCIYQHKEKSGSQIFGFHLNSMKICHALVHCTAVSLYITLCNSVVAVTNC